MHAQSFRAFILDPLPLLSKVLNLIVHKKIPLHEDVRTESDVDLNSLRDDCFNDIDLTVLFVKGNVAILEGEERVVATHADVGTWVVTSAALAHDDVSCNNGFTAKLFHAETL